MANWDEVRTIASRLPGVVEGTTFGSVSWNVGGKLVVWERPLRKPDLAELGVEREIGPVLASVVGSSLTAAPPRARGLTANARLTPECTA